jgi:hypothetical protein
MFLWPYREDLIRSEEDEREQRERRNHLLRELRGATPPFDGGLTQRLAGAMAELRGTQLPNRRVPCPEPSEAMG